jgi:DNA-binding response OmpR family regulator
MIKILILGNDPFLKALFENMPFLCLIKNNIDEGVMKFNEFSPDIIVSDFQLENENCIRFLKYIREELKNNTIPIILTSKDSDEEINLIIKKYNTHYLQNPLGFSKTIEIIKNIYNETMEHRELSNIKTEFMVSLDKLKNEILVKLNEIGKITNVLISINYNNNEGILLNEMKEKINLTKKEISNIINSNICNFCKIKKECKNKDNCDILLYGK